VFVTLRRAPIPGLHSETQISFGAFCLIPPSDYLQSPFPLFPPYCAEIRFFTSPSKLCPTSFPPPLSTFPVDRRLASYSSFPAPYLSMAYLGCVAFSAGKSRDDRNPLSDFGDQLPRGRYVFVAFASCFYFTACLCVLVAGPPLVGVSPPPRNTFPFFSIKARNSVSSVVGPGHP